MVTGERPFRGESQAALIASILQTEPVSVLDVRPTVPAPLGRIVSRCLEKEPGRRWQSAKDLASEMESMSAGDHPRAIPVGRRSWRWLVAVAALLVLSGSAWWLMSALDRIADSESPAGDQAKGPYEPMAVLPFDNITGDPALDQLALGLPTSIITQMTGRLSVVPQQTSFAHRGAEECDAAAAMGVPLIMGGILQKQGDQIRITTQLVECPQGENIWNQPYDDEPEDLFLLQDDLANRITGTVQQVMLGLAARPGKPLHDLFRGTDKEANDRALARLNQEREKDSGDHEWHIWISYAHLYRLLSGWTDDPEASIQAMDNAAQGCRELKELTAGCHDVTGQVHWMSGNGEGLVKSWKAALEATGGWAAFHNLLGLGLAISGDGDEAIEEIKLAMALSATQDRSYRFYEYTMALAHFVEGRDLDAVDWAEKSVELKNVNTLQLPAVLYPIKDAMKRHTSCARPKSSGPTETFRYSRSTTSGPLLNRFTSATSTGCEWQGSRTEADSVSRHARQQRQPRERLTPTEVHSPAVPASAKRQSELAKAARFRCSKEGTGAEGTGRPGAERNQRPLVKRRAAACPPHHPAHLELRYSKHAQR